MKSKELYDKFYKEYRLIDSSESAICFLNSFIRHVGGEMIKYTKLEAEKLNSMKDRMKHRRAITILWCIICVIEGKLHPWTGESVARKYNKISERAIRRMIRKSGKRFFCKDFIYKYYALSSKRYDASKYIEMNQFAHCTCCSIKDDYDE